MRKGWCNHEPSNQAAFSSFPLSTNLCTDMKSAKFSQEGMGGWLTGFRWGVRVGLPITTSCDPEEATCLFTQPSHLCNVKNKSSYLKGFTL